MAQRTLGRTALITLIAVTCLATACSSSASKASGTTTSSAAATSAPAATSTTTPATTVPATVAAQGSNGCGTDHGVVAPGQTAQQLDFQGVARTYQLYVPRAYTGTTPVPVVFDFHGFGSNAVQQMIYGNFKPLADAHNFLIVAPDGQGPDAARHFNLTGEQGSQNDLQMVLALLDHIESTFCVDTNRVFSTGMSDGGAMTSVLACVAGNRFAAFGAVAVILFVPACNAQKKPIAITAFSGTADPIVPFNGGKVNCCGGAQLGAAPTAMANWAAHDGCDKSYVDAKLGTEVTRRTWANCKGGAAVTFYIIEGGGHTWPGSIPIPGLGKTTTQINASDTIWDFFAAHPLR